jgi:glycosyltransferase involved in cell wall biosynthesis
VDSSSKTTRDVGLTTLHVLQPTIGGTPVVALQLIAAQVTSGQKVVVAAPEALRNRVEEVGAEFRCIPFGRAPHPNDLLHCFQLRRHLKDADLAVLHSSKAMMVGKFALRLLTASRRPKSIAIPHSWSWNVGGALKSVYVALEKMTRHWVDLYVCVSDFEQRQGREVLGDIRSIVLRNAVDIEKFAPSAERATSTTCRLLLVGRLSPQKGQDFFIPLMSQIDSASLVLLGDGPARMELEGLVDQLCLRERVKFIGEGVAENHYKDADIVVMPSRWEGMSLVLLEAMSSGLPVVASPAAAADFNECNGVVVVALQSNEFVSALQLLVGDESRRAELGRRARATAVAQCALQPRNAQWLEIIDVLACNRGSMSLESYLTSGMWQVTSQSEGADNVS